MRVLVLGGTSFVGRAVVRAALAAGASVTTLNRGVTNPDEPRVSARRADRNEPGALASALAAGSFDITVDVSALCARQVALVAATLGERAGRYALVSTISVYQPTVFAGPGPITEDSPCVAADPADDSRPDMARYGEQKRGCELAARHGFGADRVLMVRPGFILGPHENVHRVPYWLGRAAAGGVMVGPGAPDRPFQFVDVTDLARWLVEATAAGRTGTFQAMNPPGRDTWSDWLTACLEVTGRDDAAAARAGATGARATGATATGATATGATATDATATDATLADRVRWLDDDILLAAGVTPNFDLPMWVPGGLPPVATQRIEAAGFVGRPLQQTVEDSWRWLRDEPHPSGGYRPPPMSTAAEAALLLRCPPIPSPPGPGP